MLNLVEGRATAKIDKWKLSPLYNISLSFPFHPHTIIIPPPQKKISHPTFAHPLPFLFLFSVSCQTTLNFSLSLFCLFLCYVAHSLSLSLTVFSLSLTHLPLPPTLASLPLSNSQSRAHEAKDKCLKTSKSNPSSVLEKCSVCIYYSANRETLNNFFCALSPQPPKIYPAKLKLKSFKYLRMKWEGEKSEVM